MSWAFVSALSGHRWSPSTLTAKFATAMPYGSLIFCSLLAQQGNTGLAPCQSASRLSAPRARLNKTSGIDHRLENASSHSVNLSPNPVEPRSPESDDAGSADEWTSPSQDASSSRGDVSSAGESLEPVEIAPSGEVDVPGRTGGVVSEDVDGTGVDIESGSSLASAMTHTIRTSSCVRNLDFAGMDQCDTILGADAAKLGVTRAYTKKARSRSGGSTCWGVVVVDLAVLGRRRERSRGCIEDPRTDTLDHLIGWINWDRSVLRSININRDSNGGRTLRKLEEAWSGAVQADTTVQCRRLRWGRCPTTRRIGPAATLALRQSGTRRQRLVEDRPRSRWHRGPAGILSGRRGRVRI